MIKQLPTLVIIATIVTLAAACSATPHLDGHWGKSIETARETQIVNPEAGRESLPALEMDGTAAGHAVDRYHQHFKGLETQE